MLLFELANKERTMSKNLVLMRDVICIYHPEFRASRDLRAYGMKHPDIFNIERLIEESLAAVGPYELVDRDGYDFTDLSDSKTTTINAKTRTGTINSVETKIGALRITAYNPFKKSVDFFYVGKRDLKHVKSPCYGVNDHKERIRFKYSTKGDAYGMFEDYRVKSFQELATA
jgi:hypothetical protein